MKQEKFRVTQRPIWWHRLSERRLQHIDKKYLMWWQFLLTPQKTLMVILYLWRQMTVKYTRVDTSEWRQIEFDSRLWRVGTPTMLLLRPFGPTIVHVSRRHPFGWDGAAETMRLSLVHCLFTWMAWQWHLYVTASSPILLLNLREM